MAKRMPKRYYELQEEVRWCKGMSKTCARNEREARRAKKQYAKRAEKASRELEKFKAEAEK